MGGRCYCIKEERHSLGEKNAMQLFADNIQYENHWYLVSLPWKISPESLPTNYRMAMGQLNSLFKGLDQNSTKIAHYESVIQEYLEQDFIEEVSGTVSTGSLFASPCCIKGVCYDSS